MKRDRSRVKREDDGRKPRQLTVVGTVWDRWPILRLFDRTYDSRFVSLYEPWLTGEIPREHILLVGEKRRTSVLIPYKILARTVRILHLIRKHRPEVVISHHDDANMTLIPVAALLKVFAPRRRPRFVFWIRNSPELHKTTGVFGRFALFCYKHLYRLADVVIVQTKANRKLVAALAPNLEKKLLVFPNVYANAEFKARGQERLPKEYAGAYKGFTYINIGRLSHEKAQWSILRAFATVTKERKDARLVIIGDGPYKQQLVNLARLLHVEGRTTFINRTENVPMHLANADCLVFPSLSEGFPNTLTEALIMNLPCIATDCPTGPRLLLLGDDESVVRRYPVATKGGLLLETLEGKEQWDDSPLTPREQALAKAMAAMHDNARLRKASSNGSVLVRRYDFLSPELENLALSLRRRDEDTTTRTRR